MFYNEQLIFASGGRSNYRIPSVIVTNNGSVLAFCNDRKDTLSDHAAVVDLVLCKKKPGGEWSEVEALSSLDGWASTIGNATYDEEIGKYVYNQYDQVMVDGKSGEVEAFENVFIMKVTEYTKSIYLVSELLGSGDGYYACDGKIIPIKWIRENNTDPFTFTMEDGSPLYQNVGNSYVNLAPLDSQIGWE